MSRQRISRASRSRALGVLVAVCVVLGLSALPGVASAAPPQVTPLVDCYRQNTDGSYTVVFGYTSTRKWTTTIDHGSDNYLYPYKYHGSQPETFEPGTYQGVFSLRVSAADVATFRWELDRTTLTYESAASAPTCSSSTPLPALGNGTGLAIALLAGGVFGVLFVRRIIRRAAARA
ncbi:hypothetical protein [Blastococcus atacamensis]|uniref:hypothetical protein n=1 Tax=Blastococcus atacamensis TaxID=2070508 RepID=UPI000CEB9399|nr:hypothetical protein [Blastococcus atacamensis]